MKGKKYPIPLFCITCVVAKELHRMFKKKKKTALKIIMSKHQAHYITVTLMQSPTSPEWPPYLETLGTCQAKVMGREVKEPMTTVTVSDTFIYR